MHGEGSSESKQESGVYKKKIPVPFAPGPVPYSKSNEEKNKKNFLSVSLQNQFRFRDPHKELTPGPGSTWTMRTRLR